jgi:signal transduction histidine kinase/CheY-like chemotaxis protein
MEKKRSFRIKFVVIAGYLLVGVVLVIGLLAIYRNLVVFSENRIKNEDLSELLIVGNTLSRLYEIESDQNLFSAESAQQYFLKYDSIVPEINSHLDSLKQLTNDNSRVAKLDTIQFLIEDKRENLQIVALLLDSIRKAPRITLHLESSYIPKELNREISDYLTSRNLNTPKKNESDTSVVLGERRGFLDRVRDVFVASQDSTILIESKSVMTENDFKLVVDTIINKVRYSERIDLERQKQFQLAFIQRQGEMSHTNRMLTARIDDLLKGIEQEELRKSLQLIRDKDRALSSSQRTMRIVSSLAAFFAIIFGILFLIDINKSQRYRRQLEASNKRISDLLASREKLMLTISHDIKAPMSSIMGYIELMDGRMEQEKKDLYLSNMKNSGAHVLQLISTLLDYHKIEAGNWQLNERNFNLHQLVRETVSSFKPLALQKGLKYIDKCSIPEELSSYGDPYVIRQILGNIISNAIKYTAKGEVKIAATVETGENGNRLTFSVSDTGVGIATADQQLIFREFQRLENRSYGDGPVEGTGLGLAITKGFIDQLNGLIHLNSEKEKGSEFIVELPLKPRSEDDNFDNIGIHESDLEDVSVLVVDDDPTQLIMTREMLLRKKIKCITESDPGNVLAQVKQGTFDMLFIDLQMPQINGIDLVEQLQSINRTRTLPIIALSARSDLTRSDIQAKGFIDFLAKPFTSHQLYEIISRYVINFKGVETFHSDQSEPVKVKGVGALIEFVKDDHSSSCNILQSFIHETTEHIHLLKDTFARKDYKSAATITHKILPLFRMMGDNPQISMLTQLEKERPLTVKEEAELLEMLKKSVADAVALKNEIAQD